MFEEEARVETVHQELSHPETGLPVLLDVLHPAEGDGQEELRLPRARHPLDIL